MRKKYSLGAMYQLDQVECRLMGLKVKMILKNVLLKIKNQEQKYIEREG